MAEIGEVTVHGSNDWSKLQPLKINDPKLKSVSWTRYVKKIYPKKQIVLHHTVSGGGITGDLKHWEKYKTVSTSTIIDRDGTINQLFSSRYYGTHIGVKGSSFLDRHSIAVELDNWGGLVLGDGSEMKFGDKIKKTVPGKYYACYGNIVDCPVTEYKDGFRGYNFYESYTNKQIESVGELLLLWNKTYDISLDYHDDMWDVSEKALKGDEGVWSHVSFRKPSDKKDCHPQPELIAMLKTIAGLV